MFVQRLLNKSIPGYVNRLAGMGSMVSCLMPQALTGQAPINDNSGNTSNSNSNSNNYSSQNSSQNSNQNQGNYNSNSRSGSRSGYNSNAKSQSVAFGGTGNKLGR